MKKLLILIRGLPGSGKSTLAEKLVRTSVQHDGNPTAWFEADMAFMKNGEYQFDKSKLSEAHRWCQDAVRDSMKNEIDEIIVSNTFCERWEAEPYLEMAKQYNYQVQIICCSAKFGSIHNIPEESYQRMSYRFQESISGIDYITGESASMKSPFKRLVLLNVGMGSDRPFLSLIEDGFKVNYGGTGFEDLEKGDVLVFEGGVDISPQLYGEKPHPQTQYANKGRDQKEAWAFNQAVKAKIPMIGICRGAQLFTALLGGKLIQHVNGHLRDHKITTSDNKNFNVTSCHHQMMVPTGIKHELLGWSDGVSSQNAKQEPEIIFYPEVRALAIQSHPEWMHEEDPFVKYCQYLVSNLLT